MRLWPLICIITSQTVESRQVKLDGETTSASCCTKTKTTLNLFCSLDRLSWLKERGLRSFSHVELQSGCKMVTMTKQWNTTFNHIFKLVMSQHKQLPTSPKQQQQKLINASYSSQSSAPIAARVRTWSQLMPPCLKCPVLLQRSWVLVLVWAGN